VRLGWVRLDEVTLGEVRLGEVRLGEVRLGEVRFIFFCLDVLPLRSAKRRRLGFENWLGASYYAKRSQRTPIRNQFLPK